MEKINLGIVASEFNYDITYAMVELAKEHAENAVKPLFHLEKLTKDAGMGKRQGSKDAGPIKI